MYSPDMNANDYIQEIVELHFGDDGSEYCKDLKEKFRNTNFKKDIQTPEDRIYLPVETDELIRAKGASYFVPKKILRENNKMYYGMSSGTTGPRKTIPWMEETFENMMDWFEWNFSLYDVVRGKDLLTYGPSGLFQQSMESVAARLGARNIHITNDSLGQLKKIFSVDEGTKVKAARQIYENEIKPVLSSESNIGIIVTLGPIICQIDFEDVPKDTHFIIGGFGVNEREYNELKVKYGDKQLRECYGNILWTWAFTPASTGYTRNFYPPYPYVIFDVADVNNSNMLLPYGERGQVIASRFTKDMLLRWKERDVARLIRPQGQFKWNGVNDLGPLNHCIST